MKKLSLLLLIWAVSAHALDKDPAKNRNIQENEVALLAGWASVKTHPDISKLSSVMDMINQSLTKRDRKHLNKMRLANAAQLKNGNPPKFPSSAFASILQDAIRNAKLPGVKVEAVGNESFTVDTSQGVFNVYAEEGFFGVDVKGEKKTQEVSFGPNSPIKPSFDSIRLYDHSYTHGSEHIDEPYFMNLGKGEDLMPASVFLSNALTADRTYSSSPLLNKEKMAPLGKLRALRRVSSGTPGVEEGSHSELKPGASQPLP